MFAPNSENILIRAAGRGIHGIDVPVTMTAGETWDAVKQQIADRTNSDLAAVKVLQNGYAVEDGGVLITHEDILDAVMNPPRYRIVAQPQGLGGKKRKPKAKKSTKRSKRSARKTARRARRRFVGCMF